MNHLSSIQKLFIISALCVAVFINPSSASADDFDKSPALSDGAKKSIPLHVGQKPITRAKRYFSELEKLRWGTYWCLDQKPSFNILNLFLKYKNVDECCEKHVDCTKEQKIILKANYPDKTITDPFRSCYCDEQFIYCLENLTEHKNKAFEVKTYYFEHMANKCFDNLLHETSHPNYNQERPPWHTWFK